MRTLLALVILAMSSPVRADDGPSAERLTAELLVGVLVGGAASYGGAALVCTVACDAPANGEPARNFRPIVIAGGIAYAAGASLGVMAVGASWWSLGRGARGSTRATLAGAFVPAVAGIAIAASSSGDAARATGVIVLALGAPLGAIVGFNVTRRAYPAPIAGGGVAGMSLSGLW